jgi:hypothetical protein
MKEKATTTREAELEEMVTLLRRTLEQAPLPQVIQHHGYQAWFRDQRDPALAVTR